MHVERRSMWFGLALVLRWRDSVNPTNRGPKRNEARAESLRTFLLDVNPCALRTYTCRLARGTWRRRGPATELGTSPLTAGLTAVTGIPQLEYSRVRQSVERPAMVRKGACCSIRARQEGATTCSGSRLLV
jgi:hypothetical protein